MTTGTQHLQRLAVIEAAKKLARDAIAAARDSEFASPSWRFYHGVETAALHLLLPEMATAREGTAWLERQDAWFREGFLEASLLLAMASASPDPPLQVRLPAPPDRAPSSRPYMSPDGARLGGEAAPCSKR